MCGRLYLGEDIVKGRRADYREADKKHIRLGVGKRAQAIIVFLASGIPETEADGLVVDHDIGRVVIEAVNRC